MCGHGIYSEGATEEIARTIVDTIERRSWEVATNGDRRNTDGDHKGAAAGALVGGPVGAVAGGVVGFAAGPSIRRGLGISKYPHHRRYYYREGRRH